MTRPTMIAVARPAPETFAVWPAVRIPLALLAAACLTPTASAQPAPHGSRYYVLFFGADAGRFRPTRAHTWATYVRATPTADGSVVVEPLTISWLPADGSINALRPFRPEPGVNLSLHQSLGYAASRGARVAMWGPYETDALRYHLAAQQAGLLLQGGAIAYRAVDSFGNRPGVDHCVHAVTGADPVLAGRRQPVGRIGRRGTADLVGQYARAGAFDPTVRHDWLLPVLGLR
jgi:hypothetical protein